MNHVRLPEHKTRKDIFEIEVLTTVKMSHSLFNTVSSSDYTALTDRMKN